MTDLKQYIKDATRTESRIDNVVVDPNLLAGVLQIFIASGNMLDQIKKHVFYGREYDNDKFKEEFVNVLASLDQLKPIVGDNETKEGRVDVDPRVFHSLVGIATESSELMEALVLIFSEADLDKVNISEELGDLMWYTAIAVDSLNGDWDRIFKTNISKLRERFPEKFTSTAAINRNLEKERVVLEDEGNLKGTNT